jgi:hypothetical protein
MEVNKVEMAKNVKNFGKIKNAFNRILAESMVSKDGDKKVSFKQYLKKIKENDILKTQFLVYDNIEHKIEENEFKATQFVQENIELLKKFSKKDILEANLDLAKLVSFEQDNDSNEKLYENIALLIFTDKTAKNIDSIVEATSEIVNYIKTNKKSVVTESIELPTSMLSTLMVDKYNEKYNTLDESDKKILKSLIDSDVVQKKEVYSNTLRECIDLINEKLKNSDLETKDKLLSVKDKLLNDKQDINEDFEKNISKLVDLRNNLRN